MDNQKHTPDPSQNDNWLDEILGKQNVPKELGPDELAVAAAGLTHPDDAELERIVQETMAENWGAEPDQTQMFFPQEPDSAPEPATAEEPAAPEQAPTPVKKAKAAKPAATKQAPAKSKGYGLWGIPHILSTVIWIVLILVIGASLGRIIWLCAADLLALGKAPLAEDAAISITVEAGDSISDIAAKLKQVGMIRYPSLFEGFANMTGKSDNVVVGSITFKPDIVYDYNALLNALSYRGDVLAAKNVMIPEGYNCAQIFALLEKEGICSVKDLEEYAANGKIKDYWFLAGVERGHRYCLEGFLFPDTYNFYLDSDPEEVITKLLNGFDNRFSDRMVDKFVALNERLGDNQITLYELVIMASIVEKEKAHYLEGYTIASVFYNRLTHANVYPFLNSDATILYATDYRDKDTLTTDALINASPYNTYTQTGLPPTPIANPGLSSLDAALDPEETGYYYFILDREANEHVFSKTLTEHERKRRELGYI